MLRETVRALAACVVTLVVCSGIYPAAVWGLGQLIFPFQAEGSLIYDRDRTVIGSELIAQPFASDAYFQPRPSAVDYKADATGGSNLGTKNPDLRKKVAERAEAFKATTAHPVPVDLVTASGGGMDPHISPEAALYQSARVSEARKIPLGTLNEIIARHTERSGAMIGAPERVNVLLLNRALDEEKPAPAPSPEAAGSASSVELTPPTPTMLLAPPPTGESADGLSALRSRIEALAGHLERMDEQFEALSQRITGQSQSQAAMKAIEDHLSKLSDDSHRLPQLLERVDAIDGRLTTAGESFRQLRTGVRETREAVDVLAKTRRSASR